MLSVSRATKAAYCEHGLIAEIIEIDEIVGWADEILKKQTDPCIEIINISFAKSNYELLDSLRAVEGERDLSLVKKAIYSKLLTLLNENPKRD